MHRPLDNTDVDLVVLDHMNNADRIGNVKGATEHPSAAFETRPVNGGITYSAIVVLAPTNQGASHLASKSANIIVHFAVQLDDSLRIIVRPAPQPR